jgi:hypothetical protein
VWVLRLHVANVTFRAVVGSAIVSE